MRLPWVSRFAFEAAIARADAEHENAQFLRRELMERESLHAQTLKDRDLRYGDLIARYHETNGRVAGIAEQVTAPRQIVQGAQAPEFNEFPPDVAAALAVATAGFRKDEKREIYEWAAGQLADKVSPAEIAATLKHGLPVKIQPDELQ